MCEFILSQEQEDRILQIAMAIDNKLEEGTFYRYDGAVAQREFCRTLMSMNKLYTKSDINVMSFKGLNSKFSMKGTNRYSIFKYRGGANCKHYWREIEIRNDENGLPIEYDRGIVDNTKVERLNFNKEEGDNMDDLYELMFDDLGEDGVYGVSLVTEPANELESIHFSKDTKGDWKTADTDKRIIVSPVLVPNQKIYRNEIGKEKLPGYVFMSAETIERLQQNFFKKQYNHNSTLEHLEPIQDVYFFESWIIEDPKNDKSNALGFKNLEKGTWMLAMKVENEEVWGEYIKTGLIGGFSIDAQLRSEKVKNNKINFKKMNKKTIKEIIAMSIQKVAMQSEMTPFVINDELTVNATELAIDSVITDAEGNPLADLTFEYGDYVFSTDSMGIIVSVVSKDAPAEIVEVAEELAVENEAVEMADETPAEEVAVDEKDARIAELEALVATLEEENAKLKADVVLKENEVVAMSKNRPASKGIIDVPNINRGKESALEAISRINRMNK